MSRQGSVQIAVLIDTQQRLRRADLQLDRLLAERNALADKRNALDPMFYAPPRTLSKRPELVEVIFVPLTEPISGKV